MAKHVYINDIVGVLVSAVALCSVVASDREQMRHAAIVVWDSRHARPPPQHFGEDVSKTM